MKFHLNPIVTEKYFTEDGKLEGTILFRDCFMEELERKSTQIDSLPINKNDTVTLFHGTTTAYLNEILEQGLIPRSITGKNNWLHVPSSPHAVYLTNKWHYWYAYETTKKYLTEKYQTLEKTFWWEHFESLPCYIECKIPKAVLTPDEDFFIRLMYLRKLYTQLKTKKNLY